MSNISITLPVPPTLNKLFSTITKDRRWRLLRKPIRAKSLEYKNWILKAKQEFNNLDTNYKISWDEWLQVELHYFFSLYTLKGKKRIKDVDNYSKATLDFLWDNLEWFKDEYVKVLKVEKHDSKVNIVKIIISEM